VSRIHYRGQQRREFKTPLVLKSDRRWSITPGQLILAVAIAGLGLTGFIIALMGLRR